MIVVQTDRSLLDKFCKYLVSNNKATKKQVVEYKGKEYMFFYAKKMDSADFKGIYDPSYVLPYVDVVKEWLKWLKENKC